MIEAKLLESMRTLHMGAAFQRRPTAHQLSVELIDSGLVRTRDGYHYFSAARILREAGESESWAKDLVARLIEAALDAEVKA